MPMFLTSFRVVKNGKCLGGQGGNATAVCAGLFKAFRWKRMQEKTDPAYAPLFTGHTEISKKE